MLTQGSKPMMTTTTQHNKSRDRVFVKDLAAVLAMTTVCFAVAAVVWAWLFPTMPITINDEGVATLAPGAENAAFRAFGRFVLATAIIAAAVAVWAARSRPVSPIMLLWAPSAALGGSIIFAYLGTWLEGIFHPPTDSLITPAVVFGPVALLVGPALSMLSYWLTVTISDPRRPEPQEI